MATEASVPAVLDYDYVVVGSGFGGSVAALRLAEKGYRVLVVEAGKRWRTEDFPRTNWNLRKFLWLPALFCYGIQRLTLLRDTLVLSGAGVGGGSLVYAGTLLTPADDGLRPRRLAARRRLARAARAALRDGAADARRGREPAALGGGPPAPRLRPRARPRGHLPPDHRRRALRRSPRPAGRRPLLRRRGAGARHLHPVRRLHGGVPAPRQEHPRQELPLVRREARRRGAAGDQGDARRAAGRPRRARPRLSAPPRSDDPQAAQAAAAGDRPGRRLRRRRAGHGRPPAAQPRGRGAAAPLPRPRPLRAHQQRGLVRLHRARRRGGLLEGARHHQRLPPLRRHLHGGRALPQRLGRHGPARHDPHRRRHPPDPPAALARQLRPPPGGLPAHLQAHRLGAALDHPAGHADSRQLAGAWCAPAAGSGPSARR